MPTIHQSAVGAIFLDREDMHGTPYGKLSLQQGRTLASLHLNQATLLSVGAAMIEQAKQMNQGRGQNVEALDDANVGAPDAEALRNEVELGL